MVFLVDFGKRNFWKLDHDFFISRNFNQNWKWGLAVNAINCFRQSDHWMTTCEKSEKNSVENKNAKVYQCGHCEISFTRSCNLLRHLRSQHQSTKSYPCFSCPTNFGSLASLRDHQELNHSKLPLTSVSFNNICDLIDFSTEPVNSKF